MPTRTSKPTAADPALTMSPVAPGASPVAVTVVVETVLRVVACPTCAGVFAVPDGLFLRRGRQREPVHCPACAAPAVPPIPLGHPRAALEREYLHHLITADLAAGMGRKSTGRAKRRRPGRRSR